MIARAIAGFAVLAAVVGTLVAGGRITADEQPDVTTTAVSVTPARQDVACPGPLVTPSGSTGSDPELGGAATGVSNDTFLGGEVREVGAGSASDAVVGASVTRVAGGDISGLSALTCAAPVTDQWVVGGETTVGASARLVLTNPSGAAVEATVTAYGELGELDSRTVAVGPGAQQEVLLEGLVVDVAALAVHVTSTGAGVVAALQDSRLNGFQPYGTDWTTASALGDDLAIPGVGTAGSTNETATVRLVAPDGAQARLSLSTPDGAAVWEGVAALSLDAGVVVEVAIPAVDVGTVTITADRPIAAGVVVTRTRAATSGVEGDTAQELRWVPAQPVGDENERAAVAVGYAEQVVVYAPHAGTFTIADASGTTIATADLAEGATAALPVSVAPGTQLTASGDFAWAVVATDGDFLTSYGPTRTTVDPVEIEVAQRPYVPLP